MRNLATVANDCQRKLDAIGIPYRKSTFTVNTRAKKRWGQCCPPKQRNGAFAINISKRLLMDDVELKSLEDTVLHELLHTCEGCLNHGPKWKMYAAKVNRTYGYNIKRCTSSQEKGIVPDPVVAREDMKYLVRCKSCGRLVGRQRKTHFVEHCECWRCGVCGGNFERIR